MEEKKLRSLLRLQMTPSVGPLTLKNLIAYCGSPEAIFREKQSHLMKIPGVGKKIVSELFKYDAERIDNEVRFIEMNGIQPLYFLDHEYPERLKDIDDAPVMLYYKGNGDLNHSRTLGIVGTRMATDYGRECCKKLVEGLVELNVSIISGLAHGIDEMAHQSAVKNELETIGVLGHGLRTLYPAQNRILADKMVKKGGLLTEFPSDTLPIKDNFPARNRIIASLVDGLVVIESGPKGGALITAEIAYSYNREVMAYPGRVIDERSKGCNHLIKLNKAYFVENAYDVAFHLGWDTEVEKPLKQKKATVETTEEEDKVLGLLNGGEKININTLAKQLDYPVSNLSVILFNMELKGLIRALPGYNYRKT